MNITNPIASIESKLFTVVEHDLVSTSDIMGTTFEPPKTKALYKSTGGAPIGEIGKQFSFTQPKVLFDAFIDCFGDYKALDVNKLDYQETKGGSKVRFQVEVADFGFKNGVGKTDDLKTYATLTTGFDGLTKTSLSLECFRLICTNGMKVRGTTSLLSIKNVKGNAGKIESICNDFGKIITASDNIQDWFKHLNTVEVSEVIVQKVIKDSFGYNRATEDIGKGRLVTLDDIEARIALEIGRSGGNLWGLLNGITNYTNHGGRAKTDMIAHVYQDGGNAINDRAQRSIAGLA